MLEEVKGGMPGASIASWMMPRLPPFPELVSGMGQQDPFLHGRLCWWFVGSEALTVLWARMAAGSGAYWS